jgi:hypothetical protein
VKRGGVLICPGCLRERRRRARGRNPELCAGCRAELAKHERDLELNPFMREVRR